LAESGQSVERKCSNCGALPTSSALRFCGYCGTELPRAAVQAAALIHAPLGDIKTRFQALETHPSVPKLLEHRPRTSQAAAAMMGQAVFGIVFAAISTVMFFFFAAIAGPFALFPLIFIGIGVVITVTGLRKSISYNSAPLERKSAAVVDERVKVSGGGQNSRAQTTYFASLEFPSEKRREFEVPEELAGDLAPGDLGIAFVKGPFLVDFLRVDV
jgi:hypothetical protein